ncbi:MAG TPA: phospho-N-acetylmuramoyl-pentapeptide-transferase [Anaerovoracaceae bacterium]|nr:phospho-N-acetylmuramoyl-pentapeptide-transferase [Anaerovoracaceae bacterium]
MNYMQIILPLAISLIITSITTPFLISFMLRRNGGQCIREDGPKSHMSKAGTPTMGGLAIIFAVLITCSAVNIMNKDMLIILIAFTGYGLLGFLDDYVKVSMKRNLGLTAKQKLFLQILIAVALAIYQAKVSVYGTTVVLPFSGFTIDLGLFYVPFIAFVVVAMVNSVNLTDGLDGLASGVTMFVALFLALVGNAFSFAAASTFCSAITGACLGFLFYNRHPAKIFMGDTGSMALGGGIAAAAIIMNIELIIPIAGGVYVLEALSVILQVLYFKATGGKRLFRMSPLHHHFELLGWKETKVVAMFWAITIGLCVIGLLAI